MKKILKHTTAIVLVIIMVFGTTPLAGLEEFNFSKFSDLFSTKANAAVETDNSGLIYGINNQITKAEWLHNLSVVFEMTVENDEYPDNYFSDLESSNEYYYDVLLNVQFGVIDVEAGGEVNPDALATRGFTSQTLNYCLGYQLDSTDYSFSDASECSFPDDAQVAVDRGWFDLINGAFVPSQPVNTNEVTTMLNDAITVLGKTVASDNYHNEYIINSSFIEIPEDTEIVVDSDTSTITITDSPKSISEGDSFVIYQNSIANAFNAESVTTEGNITTITYSDIAEDDAFEYVDAQGTTEADFNNIEALDGTEIVYIDDETGDEYDTPGEVVSLNAARGTKKFNKTIKASKKINLDSGFSVTVEATIKNPEVVYNINTVNKEAFAYLQGDTSVKFTVKIDTLGELLKECKLSDIRLVNLTVPGVGGIVVSVDASCFGTVSGTTSGFLKAGVQYSGGYCRLIQNFKSRDFTLTLEVKGTLGVQLKLGLTDLPVFKGYFYAKIGMTGGIKHTTYSGNVTPKECTQFSAHLYASAGVNVIIDLIVYKDTFSISQELFNEKNSPVRISHHYEDGKKVYFCSHGSGSVDGDNGYRTPGNSRYNDAGWYGKSSSVGYDSSGNPITIYTYTLDEDNNATITSYSGNATALNIPEKIDGYTVVGIGNNVFSGNESLRSVMIPDTITVIGDNAFLNCYNLSEITLSKNLLTIGKASFRNCESLTNIWIPKSLNNIDVFFYNTTHGPFDGCINLTTVEFEENITKIPADLFNSCEGIKSVSIPITVTEIGTAAFARCTNLVSVEIPDSVKYIDDYAFEDCPNLSSINLPPYLVAIGAGAFKKCLSIKKVFIPKSLESIDVFYYNTTHGPFDGCINLATVEFEENITKIPADLFNSCEGIKSVSIPITVTEIGTAAFARCTNLVSVEIPDSVKYIDDYAFEDCPNLSNINLPLYLISIGEGAFKKCASIEKIFIPKSLVNIGVFYTSLQAYHGPFDGCINLTTAEFEENISKIPANLFNSCDGLQSVFIPDTVTEICDSAFARCDSLTIVTLPQKLATIADNAFYQCPSLSSIELPTELKHLGTSSFAGCSSITDIVIPKSIEYIYSNTFSGCQRLKSITLHNNIIEIQKSAFKNCSSLVEVVFPEKIVSIAAFSFYGCSSLKEVEIPNNITQIGENAFGNCSSLSKVNMTNSVSRIDGFAFQGCESLTDIMLSNNLDAIPESAFSGCSSLESIVIPKGVSSIRKNAFLNCVSLKSIIIPVTVSSIDSSALSYPDRTVIFGCKGSYAESYANEYSFEFVDITKHITGIVLKDNENELITITKGCYNTPEFEYLPADTTDVITLTSNDTSIVTVNSNKLYGRSNGSATVTATTTGGLEYTFNVYVHTLSSISVANEPIKTSYKYGENLDLTGLVITASFDDDMSETITEYTVNGYDPNVYGTQTVTVSFNGKKATFIVEVIDDRTKLTSIAITQLPNKTAYEKGESFDASGMIVTGYFSDGTSAEITDYSVSAMNSLKIGTQTLIVSYEGFSATLTVTVGTVSVSLSSIAVKTNPNKTVYMIGESFDATGLVLLASYSDGSTKEISSGYSVDGFSSSTSGTKAITITYEGKSTTLNVTVKENGSAIENTYTITFYSNGGSSVNPITAEEGSAISTPANPTRIGYTFAGWMDKNGNSISVPSIMPSQNITLYAKWAVNSYTVTWVVDNSSTEQTYKYCESIIIPANPEREGCVFVGWSPSVPSTMPAYDLTFTAIFEEIPDESETHTVTWIVDGRATTAVYNVGDAIVIPANPSKSGYRFVRWSPSVPSTMPAYDLTFTAVFEAVVPPTVPHFEAGIVKPSTSSVDYGDSIILHAQIDGTLPEGAYIVWSGSNGNFDMSVSDDGMTCKISPRANGKTTFTITVYDKDGKVISSGTQVMTAKAGLWQRIVAIFKNIFGLTKTIPQIFKGVF